MKSAEIKLHAALPECSENFCDDLVEQMLAQFPA